MKRRTAFLLAAVAVALLPGRPAAQTRASLEPVPVPAAAGNGGDSLAALRAALDRGRAPERALADFLAGVPASDDEARGRLFAAIAAWRSGRQDIARGLLAPPLIERADYLGAYSNYLLGLLRQSDDPGLARRHFTAAWERAGTTDLRHRAALWLAEAASLEGDAAGALALLDAVAGEAAEPALEADLEVRRALLLLRLGRADEGHVRLERLYLEQPLLGYRAQTAALYKVVRAELEGRIDGLDPAARIARAETLAEAGHPREAALEARSLLRARGADRDRVRLLLARTELDRRAPRRALPWLRQMSPRSAQAWEGRRLEARALAQLGRERESERLLESLARDPQAGATRARAALDLARKLEDDRPDRAAVFYALAAEQERDPDRREEAMWKCGWLAYARGDDAAATERFGRLAAGNEGIRSRARAVYWGARTFERSGRNGDAALLLAEVIREQPAGYYGLLARERLAALAAADPALAALAGEMGRPDAGPEPPDPLAELDPTLAAALAPARELLALGLREDALAELAYQSRRFPGEPAPLVLLAEVHHEAGDFRESVAWLKRAFPDHERSGLPEAWRARLYPLAFWDSIRLHAEAAGVDPYLAAAVIYQESRFRSEARSSAGAVGLMQIMPRTGREIARSLREPPVAPRHLLEPERNIRYGIAYFRRLIEDLGGSPVRALAGYNAGSARARRWARGGAGDLDEYVEAIPFRETRNYVKNILVAHAGYHRVYGAEEGCGLLR